MAKEPRPVLPGNPASTIFAFSPNRDTLGGTAYLVVAPEGNILVDCPAWEDANQAFLHQQGGVRWLFLTHRGGMGKVREIQSAFNCEIVLQEQEAYLLPSLEVTSFQREFEFTPHTYALWTPGHSPGSACLYHQNFGGVLFSGRHLLPDPQGQVRPLQTAKTFHWPRQLRSVQALRDRFTSDTLSLICPGANTGFLRGELAVQQAHQHLQNLQSLVEASH